MGSYAASLTWFKHFQFPNHPPDFGVAWFGARAMLHGENPYSLVGPGLAYEWPWALQYPATAFVSAMPLSFLPEMHAAMVFVFLTTVAFAFGLTADGWYRMPLFFTTSFVAAAAFAQWSILFCAGIVVPAIALLFASKPNLALATLAAEAGPTPSSRPARVSTLAIIGGSALLAISLALLPEWPRYWMDAVGRSHQLVPPVLLPWGFVVLLALLRWRRWEARLILALAFVPQTTYWYEALPLFLIPRNLAESILLALIASTGMLIEQYALSPTGEVEHYRQIGTLMVLVIYLPATIMILRRPNTGERPVWLRFASRINTTGR